MRELFLLLYHIFVCLPEAHGLSCLFDVDVVMVSVASAVVGVYADVNTTQLDESRDERAASEGVFLS